MALSPGTRLGPYEILAPLGAGGMGEVYRAKDSRLEREVAVKVLPPAFASDAERLRRFEQEARAAGALNHPNILTIHDIGTHDGSPYLVSELLDGETLRERLSGGPLPQRRAVEYAVGVAQGLAAAHAKGIVHRDLKPENLFLTKDGRAKILDFGLAKLTHREAVQGESLTGAPTLAAGTEPGVVLGTVGYMSPEQVRGAVTDHRSDIFSFGVIFYEMLTGQRAFRGGSAIETMNAILREEPAELTETNRHLSPALERVLRHCLEKEPEQRFQSARDLVFDLESLSGVSGTARAALGPAPERSRRRIALLGAAALALVAVGVGSFVAGQRAGRIQPAFRQLTFRRGPVPSARFAPDGQTIIYGAAWDGNPIRLFSTRPEGTESRQLDLPNADILAVSASGEMAISIGRRFRGHLSSGTLGRALLAGGAPREVLEGVQEAAWGPAAGLAVIRRVEGRHRLEFPVGKVLYQTTGWISHPRVSPQWDLIAFLDHPVMADDLGSVAVVDLAGKSRTLTNQWGSVQGLAWSASGNEIWFTATQSGLNSALRAVTLGKRQRVVLQIPGRLMLHDISRDGRVLVSQDKTLSAVMCLPPGATKEGDLSWLDWSRARDFSSDGKTLLLDEQGEGGGPRYSTYLRKTDGSPAIRLGDGQASALSPDGKWALATLPTTSPVQLTLLPTGAGEARTLAYGSLSYTFGVWLPDGKRILVQASEPGHGQRLYVQDLAGGAPRPIATEGVTGSRVISLDGDLVACTVPGQKPALCPIEGGEPRAIPGMVAGEAPVRFSGDGKFLFVTRLAELPAKVYRLDLSTGRREPWKEIAPADPAGVDNVGSLLLAADGRSYAYTYRRSLSDLYLVEGLR